MVGSGTTAEDSDFECSQLTNYAVRGVAGVIPSILRETQAQAERIAVVMGEENEADWECNYSEVSDTESQLSVEVND